MLTIDTLLYLLALNSFSFQTNMNAPTFAFFLLLLLLFHITVSMYICTYKGTDGWVYKVSQPCCETESSQCFSSILRHSYIYRHLHKNVTVGINMYKKYTYVYDRVYVKYVYVFM